MDCLKKLGINSINAGGYSGFTWESKTNTNLLPSMNPATETLIAEVMACTQADYEYIVQESQQVFKTWRQVPAPVRGDIIRQIAHILREVKNDLACLISLEMGKSLQESLGEVQEMIDTADFAVGQSRMLYGKTMHSERPLHRMYEQWHPYGVAGVITAFNFPVAVWAWNAFIAAICGNVTLWKPSSKTPLCAIAVQKICNHVLKANNLPAIFSLIISHEHEIAETMVDDPRIPLISFTGSTQVGRRVAMRVARRFGRSILELGGNNAIIIDESANLNIAIPSVVFGAVGTAGQRCTTTRRLYVQKSIYDMVLTRLKHAYAKISIGDPFKQNLMGPLIDLQAVDKYQQAISSIKTAGGRIISGGSVKPGKGFYVEPTLIEGIDHTHKLLKQETFVPILYLIPFTSLDEGIFLQNDVPQGLSSALFTQNLMHAEYYLSTEGSDCGIANINIGTSGAEIGGAFGGEKETGGGRESGSDAWKAYMRRQTNTINWGSSLPLAQGIQFEI